MSRRTLGGMLLSCGAIAGVVGGFSARGTSLKFRDGMPRSSPGEQGVDARGISSFLDEVAGAGLELHSFMLYRHGHVVAEGWWWPYRPERPHMMHSLTKSVTACAVGLALSEERFALDDKVISFFKGELPATVDENLAAMTVRDLLTMRTGHAEEVSGSVWRQIKTSWVSEFFKVPVVHRPGTTFVYSSAASFMLSAIVTKTTGESVREYLESRFFRPLGIRDSRWDIGPGGINPGGNGLSWTTADVLKLGAVHLARGQWRGRQIIPAAWVQAATRQQVPDAPYGYQWWMGRGNAYYAAGKFSQLGVVFPGQDAVLAVTAAIADHQHLLAHVWQHFPAAFGESRSVTQASAEASLRHRCATLRLPPLAATSHSPLMKQLSGRVFLIEPNEDGVRSIRFDFSDGRCVFTLQDARGEHRIEAGLREWIEGDTTMTGNKLHHEYQPDRIRVVAGARWLDERSLEMTWQFVETAFRDRVLCHFDADTVTLDRSVNVNSGATSRPTLRGKISSAPAKRATD